MQTFYVNINLHVSVCYIANVLHRALLYRVCIRKQCCMQFSLSSRQEREF